MAALKSPFDLFRGTRYFPALDGMRAFCVVLVMFNHVHVHVPKVIDAPLGVDVFFVLSGFLITTLMLREDERMGRISLKAFYVRRFFRIVPVYFFTILLYGVAVAVLHDPTKTAQYRSALPWLVTFMDEYKPAAAGNVLGHAWTLGVEEKFYLLWPPLVVLLIPFRGRKAMGLPVLFAAVLMLHQPFASSYGGLLLGAILAVALSAQAGWNFIQRLSPLPDMVLCLLVAASYAWHNYRHGAALLFSASIAMLIASLVLRTGLVRTLLEFPPFVFVGKRSYALYLIHVLVIDTVERFLPRFVSLNWINVVGLSFLIGLLGASLMHIAIELPCIRLGRRLSNRLAGTEPLSQRAT